MLKGIAACISPELLKNLAEMGHGDEIVISDAHFPAHTFNANVIRADGVRAEDLLAGIAPLFELDAYAVPVAMMSAVSGDELDPSVETAYRRALGYDGEIERVQALLASEEVISDYERLLELTNELEQLQAEQEQQYEIWEELSD